MRSRMRSPVLGPITARSGDASLEPWAGRRNDAIRRLRNNRAHHWSFAAPIAVTPATEFVDLAERWHAVHAVGGMPAADSTLAFCFPASQQRLCIRVSPNSHTADLRPLIKLYFSRGALSLGDLLTTVISSRPSMANSWASSSLGKWAMFCFQ